MKSIWILCLSMIFTIGASAQNVPVVVEAESGTLGADFDPSIVDGMVEYIAIESNGTAGNPESAARIASYSVTFNAAGEYDLYVRLRVGAGGADDDSFFYGNGFGTKTESDDAQWIRVNNVAAAGYFVEEQFVDGGGSGSTDIWKWLNLSEFMGDEAPITFTVEEGSLTVDFQVGGREDGLQIDKFAFAPSDRFYTVSDLENGGEGSVTLPDPDATPPIADGQSKFLGNIYSTSQLTGFTNYWNQVTPENAGKWGSVEPTRDQYNFGPLDAAYALAKDNGFPFKLHVLIWGAQQPSWIESLDPVEQLEEITEWMDTLAARYPDIDFIEVVNEPLHQPPSGAGKGNYIEALGGNGSSGWDWVITAFQMARDRFPTAKLVLNDYGIISDANAINQYKVIINLLKNEGLIDHVGIQSHAFNVNDLSASTITLNLNSLGGTGLPIYITELDIDGPTDEVQLNRYKRAFPAIWENSNVKGVTLWGYRPGMWRTDQMAYLIDTDGVTERPALKWLRAYVNGNFVEITNISVSSTSGSTSIDVKDGTLQLEIDLTPIDPTIADIKWSVNNESIATIDDNGLLTAKGNGTVTVTASSKDGSGVTGTFIVTISNQLDPVTGLEEEEPLVIFPNPVNNGNFTISGIAQIKTLRVIDLRGNTIKSMVLSKISSLQITLDQSPGVYVIELNNGSRNFYHKVILK